MRSGTALSMLAVCFSWVSTSHAQEIPAAIPSVRWDHGGQFTLRAGLSEGYRFVIRYQDGPGADPCDDGDNKFCVGLAPLMLDTGIGFGVTRGLEIEARSRLGVLTDFDGSRPLQLGLGLRTLTDPDSRLKFVLAVSLFADITGDRRRGSGSVDMVVRAEEGLQYDVNRWIGVTACVGESFGLLRNFSSVVDVNLGVQFRAPP
jgi:hypothetical protein